MAEKTRTISSSGESESENGHELLFNTSFNSDNNSIMNSSQISNSSIDSHHRSSFNITHGVSGNSSCRFPKLEECAHFHYERVQLGKLVVLLVDDKSESSQMLNSTDSSSMQNNFSFIIKVTARQPDAFLIKRSLDNLKFLDEMLHRCVYDRRISELEDLKNLEISHSTERIVSNYLTKFSTIASDAITCGPVLTWLQLDNKGRRLPVADSDTMRTINTPAVGAAYGVRRYVAQACDEISIEVGDMISVIDMPSPAESVWWRGKKSHLQKSQYEVGFFPQSCVATIGDKVPRHMPLPPPLVGSLAVSPTKPVLRKHGKLIAFFRSFILARPSRRRLKQSGIYKERVFSCDLGEHLLNSRQDIPMVLKCCAEFIEQYGIVDGIYRLSGITSNIQKLRRAFDEERIPDLWNPEIKQDIHAVGSLLKMYFRELPNPLCTYQLYDHFVDAIQTRDEINDSEHRLRMIRKTVQKLPPPHYRTLKYLATHLYKISRYSASTGMTERNIAIVWAPNLLRSPALEAGGVAALRGVGVQAVVTEYLISNCEQIFDESTDDFSSHCNDSQPPSLSDTSSVLHGDQRGDYDLGPAATERPKSLNVGGTKLLSLEEARSRKSRKESIDKGIPINTNSTHSGCSSYIEVGGGPSSLPDKYHTVLPVPRSWNKRKTNSSSSSWKNIFSRAPKSSNSNNDIKHINETTPTNKEFPSTLIEIEHTGDSDKDQDIASEEDNIAKNIDIFDGKSITTEVGVRSNSIDSLRTAGHSRSVSHDSYFDLLQSPLRGIVNCSSREYSELGINFDREEPEMRLFSESESLVSSPKVAKEQSVRRSARDRPEDMSQNTNSGINPSPKKQPRLNLLNSNDVSNKNWSVPNDESLCKRYKLEDQLSDIQYIDCNTPEHVISSTNAKKNPEENISEGKTIYTSVQVHNPPHYSDENFEQMFNSGNNSQSENTEHDINERFSYPGIQFKYSNNKEQNKEDRFSYPGNSSNKTSHNSYYDCDNAKVPKSYSEDLFVKNELNQHHHHHHHHDHNNPQHHNRYLQQMQNSKSQIENEKYNDINKIKLNVVTPQSPIHSPCYSLLVASTSSDNSSSIATPIFDLDSCNVVRDFNLETKDTKNCNLKALKNEMSLDLHSVLDDKSGVLSTPNTPNMNNISSSNNINNNCNTHTETDNTSQSSMTPSDFGYQNLLSNRQSNLVSLENSPIGGNKPPLTTSKPTTPIKSTINIIYNLKSPTLKNDYFNYDDDNNEEQEEENQNDVMSYVYENCAVVCEDGQKKLLETTFDENMVYEQVKFLKNTVSELNYLCDEDTSEIDTLNLEIDNDRMNGNRNSKNVIDNVDKLAQIVPDITTNVIKIKSHCRQNKDVENMLSNKTNISTDIQMTEQISKEYVAVTNREIEGDIECLDDSLEFDPNISLYENVELRHPSKVYENIDVSAQSTLASATYHNKENFPINKNEDLNNEMEYKIEIPKQVEIKTFSVRQLANKFEKSPTTDAVPPFDFGLTRKKSNPQIKNLKNLNINNNHNNNNESNDSNLNNNTNNNKNFNITRSLDENAFVREFGGVAIKKLENFTKSIQQIPEIETILADNNNSRRKSLEFTRPKSLNPPKRLPNLVDSEYCKQQFQLQANIADSAPIVNPIKPPSKLQLDFLMKNEASLLATANNNNIRGNERITPTTENRISLIQYNNLDGTNRSIDDESTLRSSLRMENTCKLNRERIEKIKEERRLQLNEKYRSESFSARGDREYSSHKLKSKSKTELSDNNDKIINNITSMRLKSKSRNELSDTLFHQQENSSLLGNKMISSASAIAAGADRLQNISLDSKSYEESELETDIYRRKLSQDNNTLINDANISDVRDNKFELKQRPKYDKLSNSNTDCNREQNNIVSANSIMDIKNNFNTQRERYSPQISIKDVAAMFESRSQNQTN